MRGKLERLLFDLFALSGWDNSKSFLAFAA